MTKNFTDRGLFHRNYYVVSTTEHFQLINKIDESEIPEIRKTGKYKFRINNDSDSYTELNCRVVVEEIQTNKRYFDLFM